MFFCKPNNFAVPPIGLLVASVFALEDSSNTTESPTMTPELLDSQKITMLAIGGGLLALSIFYCLMKYCTGRTNYEPVRAAPPLLALNETAAEPCSTQHSR